MYSVFEQLMKKKNVKASDVSKATGIAPATLTDWKNGRSTPKDDKRKKIAEYFGVSLEYLDTGIMYDPYTDKDAKLLGIIRNDENLRDSILLLNDLSAKNRDYVFQLIHILSEKENNV